MTEGISQQEARDKIWMVDIDGLLGKNVLLILMKNPDYQLNLFSKGTA